VAADPDAIIKVGGDIWVASCKGNEITVINDSTKQIVEEYGSNSNYQLDCPDALAFDDGYVWVANNSNSSLVQFNASTGAWVQTQGGSDILNPDAIAVSGANIWVANNNSDRGSFLSEFNASTGTNLYMTKNTIRQSIGNATCVAVSGSNIWVSDAAGGNVYEYNASSGAYLRENLGGGGGISGADCVSYYGGYIWVTSDNNSRVLEYNATSGVYVREILNINGPDQVIFNGNSLFVVGSVGLTNISTVQEYNSSGSFIRTVMKANTGNFLNQGMEMLYDDGNLWVANPASNNVTLYKL
jgi:hypothetical protein